jgi:hypothetical protein
MVDDCGANLRVSSGANADTARLTRRDLLRLGDGVLLLQARRREKGLRTLGLNH